ncbi:MAG: bifunctional demethylmenaquinone methyltransferase/2-methoxy-6-polyprenyl-1,4-benzoquinol methylase UbiE, partial [Rickettsiales bacterium]|nr:bifunctional demethylmenaquinone methyltransferase/2-methoxy-6-polyprenyl-1,4-benzoquinol methylase UbiE [Rickettsiales bacterium]
MSKANFGFKQVEYSEKQEMVFGVFKSVASKYDIMNDFMSFGLHRIWKKIFLKHLPLRNDLKALDLASGSADIVISLAKKLKEKCFTGNLIASDINNHMLEQGRGKVIDENFSNYIDFNIVNAEEIPYPDNNFDLVTISFGIRNVTNIKKALDEIYRVLKPGGKFVCLEFSDVNNEVIKKVYDFYSFNFIPKIGKFVAKDEDSYQYLVESIRMFPTAENFKAMIEKSGFENVNYEKLTFG